MISDDSEGEDGEDQEDDAAATFDVADDLSDDYDDDVDASFDVRFDAPSQHDSNVCSPKTIEPSYLMIETIKKVTHFQCTCTRTMDAQPCSIRAGVAESDVLRLRQGLSKINPHNGDLQNQLVVMLMTSFTPLPTKHPCDITKGALPYGRAKKQHYTFNNVTICKSTMWNFLA
jgi:hypothetical protein